MARPKNDTPSHSYSLRVPDAVKTALAARAAADGQTITQVTLAALRRYLGLPGQ